MTTDPFTEAGLEAAEQSRARELGGPPNGAYDGYYLTGFKEGWHEARTHLATQEPTTLPDESEMEVVGEWLVVRNAQEPDYPAGPEWGPYPYSDAAPLIQLSRVAGYPPEPQEPTEAEVEAAAKAQYRNPDGWDLALAAYRKRVAEEGPIPSHVIAHRLELARDALLAARAVRRDEEKR